MKPIRPNFRPFTRMQSNAGKLPNTEIINADGSVSFTEPFVPNNLKVGDFEPDVLLANGIRISEFNTNFIPLSIEEKEGLIKSFDAALDSETIVKPTNNE